MMKKILMMIVVFILSLTQLQAVPSDKFQHAFVGVGIYAGCFLVKGIGESMHYDMDYLDAKTCLIPVVAAGVGKELWDSQHRNHTAEWQDAAATIAIPLGTFVLVEW